jgi:protein SCO1/2
MSRLSSVAQAFQPVFFFLVALLCVFSVGCHRDDETGSFPAANKSDCLPDLALLNQNGRAVNLSSLKGEFVLINFIYTSCSGTCPMLTSKMAAAEKRLGPELGKKAHLISITLDPEHDNSATLLKYANEHGANVAGWDFLTGTPSQIDSYLAIFKIKRTREPDGSIDHVTTSFLLGPDGREIRQYDGISVTSATLAADLSRAISHG